MINPEDEELTAEGLKLWEDTLLKNSTLSLITNYAAHKTQIEYLARLRCDKFNVLVDEGFTREEAPNIIINTQLFG